MSLDRATAQGRIKADAYFDNCAGSLPAHAIEQRTTTFTSEHTVR